MKRYLIGISVALIAGLVGIGGYFTMANASPSQITFQTSAAATTTVSYLVPNIATSTYAFNDPSFASGKQANMQQVDSVAFYAQVVASSTSSVFNFTPQFSNNGIDWYNLAVATSTATVAGASPLTNATSYQWTASGTATTSLVFSLPSVPSNYERVVISVTGANGAVYNEVDLKKLPSTP